MPGANSGAPIPTATALASGVQQSSATITAGLAKVILVAADGVTPLLARTDNTLAVATLSVDAALLANGARTTRQSIGVAGSTGHGAIFALTINNAPNTSETLTMRWYPTINANTNATIFQAAASFVTAIGTSLQTPPYTFFLMLYPGATSAPDVATYYKQYSMTVPRAWSIDVNPSGASSWTYQLDYGAIS